MESGLSQVGSNRLGESDLVGSPRDDFVPRLVGQELNFFGRDGLIFVGEGVRNFFADDTKFWKGLRLAVRVPSPPAVLCLPALSSSARAARALLLVHSLKALTELTSGERNVSQFKLKTAKTICVLKTSAKRKTHKRRVTH